VTDRTVQRGQCRPVAQMTPLPTSRLLQSLLDAGQAGPAPPNLADLPPPGPGPSLSAVLQVMRDDER